MSNTRYRLRFPRDLSDQHVLQVLLALHGASTVNGLPISFTITSSPEAIEHHLTLPDAHRGLPAQLPRLAPGLVLEPDDTTPPTPTFLWRLWQSSSRRPMRIDYPEVVTRATLGALRGVRRDESLALRWTLGPVRRPSTVASRGVQLAPESWPLALASAPILPPKELDADARAALRTKRQLQAWRLIGQLAVRAADHGRARQLAGDLMAAIRTSEGPGVRLGVRRRSPKSFDHAPWRWDLQANVGELVGLVAWPIADTGRGLPVAVEQARQLAPAGPMPRSGRSFGLAVGDRHVRLGDEDARRHVLLVAPTGGGKSTLIARLALQSIQARHGVLLLDPRGDLVDAVLGHFPESRRDDLVVIDPTDVAPVGVNPLHRPSNPALVADQLVGIFTGLYGSALGPRTLDLLTASLITLARWGEGSLAVLPLLLTNAQLRRRIVGNAPDPLGTGPFWSWFERLKDAERQQVIAPGLNKLRQFTVRPDLRAVLGQTEPRFRWESLVRGRPVILVDLSKGELGAESSALLGSVLLNSAWQTLQARTSLPEHRRPPLHVYVDEIADFLRLPGDTSEALIQARALNVSFTLAAQHMGLLPSDLRQAAMANARSKVIWQLAADDAKLFAQGHPEFEAQDIMNLPPFQAYASLLRDNQVQPYISLRTEPLAEPTADPATLRRLSRERWGRSRSDTDTALQALLGPTSPTPDDSLGSRPRRQP